MHAPVGELTLIFTDVQGSTRLWESDAEAMGQALALHNRVLRSLISEHGGYEVKTEGDAFMVAFGNPLAAVDWCMAAQCALHAAQWPAALLRLPEAAETPDIRGLRVRMGGHLGRPTCLPDPLTHRMDYFGPMVNRAARVGSCGHGGQIVLSQALAQVAKPVRPGSWKSLGTHGLRGLRSPETLWMVTPPSLSSRRFPPLRTTTARRHNLPALHTELLGRQTLLAQAEDALMQGARLVCLVGPAGVGKTLLALHMAHRVEASGARAGGTWWVDLVHADGAEDVLQSVGAALGVPVPSSGGIVRRAEGLAKSIGMRGSLLLAIDNAEQVLDPVRTLLRAFSEHAVQTAILVTSRTRTDLRGEVLVKVLGLSESEGVALLESRARAVTPAFRIDDLEAAHALVRQLDGWPLAIELAAARLGTLPIRRVLERMSQRFRLLARRGAQGRQATLAAALDWSWELLSEDAQVVLASFTVFHAPVAFDDAMDVLAHAPGDPWVDDALDELLRHHLVRRVDATPELAARFTLYVSVRAFAELKRPEVLADSDWAAVQSAHAAWSARFGVLGVQWSDASSRHEDLGHAVLQHGADLRAALTYALSAREISVACQVALALAHLALYRGPVESGLEPLRSVLAQPILAWKDAFELRLTLTMVLSRAGDPEGGLAVLAEEGDDAVPDGVAGLRLLLSRFDVLRLQGDIQSCHAVAASTLARVDADCPPVLAGHVHNQQGILASHEARYAEGDAHYRRAITLYGRAGMQRQRAKVALNLGGDLAVRGRVDDARSLLFEALEGAESSRDRRFVCYAHLNVGLFEHLHGSAPRAWELAVEGERIARDIGDEFAVASARMNQGRCLRSQGRSAEAETALRDAVRRFDAAQSGYWMAFAQHQLAIQRLRVGDHTEAATLLTQSRTFFAQQKDPGAMARLDFTHGLMLLRCGELAAGERAVEAARTACLRTEQVAEATEALITLARMAWRSGDSETARLRYETALGEAASWQLWATWIGAANNLGILHAQKGDLAAACVVLDGAVDRARTVEHQPLLATGLANLAEARLDRNPKDPQAAGFLEEAAHINDSLGFRDRVGGIRRTQARLALRTGARSKARAYVQRAVDDATASGSMASAVAGLALWSEIEHLDGHVGLAKELAVRARTQADIHQVAQNPLVREALARLP